MKLQGTAQGHGTSDRLVSFPPLFKLSSSSGQSEPPSPLKALGLFLLMVLPSSAVPGLPRVAINTHRRSFEPETSEKLQPKWPEKFRFGQYQSPASVKAMLDGCRPRSKFKWYEGKDGRKGYVCSTKLSGDWVLAESEQLAPECSCEEVMLAYLDKRLNSRWNADKVANIRYEQRRNDAGRGYYLQDLVLRSQRILRKHTGPMRYSQTITVDKIGNDAYCAIVELDPEQESTARKPFEALCVYVSFQQQGPDVGIYAAGVMQVNRRVVPNLLVFDASGIAGDQAGKGTLWLSGHFEDRSGKPVAKFAQRWPEELADGPSSVGGITGGDSGAARNSSS